jgi:hypothetical protein
MVSMSFAETVITALLAICLNIVLAAVDILIAATPVPLSEDEKTNDEFEQPEKQNAAMTTDDRTLLLIPIMTPLSF